MNLANMRENGVHPRSPRLLRPAGGTLWLSRCAQAGQRMRAVIPSFDLT